MVYLGAHISHISLNTSVASLKYELLSVWRQNVIVAEHNYNKLHRYQEPCLLWLDWIVYVLCVIENLHFFVPKVKPKKTWNAQPSTRQNYYIESHFLFESLSNQIKNKKQHYASI